MNRSTLSRALVSTTAAALIAFAAAAGNVAPAFAQGGRGGAAKPEPPAGPIPRTPDGKPDLRGRWLGSGGALTHTNIIEEHAGGFGIQAGHSLIIDPKDGVIPYLPAALELRDKNRLDDYAYLDPASHCESYGMARLHQFPQEFVYNGNQILIYAFQHITRVVEMNRKQHLPDTIRLWMGDALGRWDGDTFVIDTTNFNGKTWMGFGDYHGADAHIVERYTMVDSNTMNWTMTIENPKVFSRPWTMTSAGPFKRQTNPDPDDYAEDACHEHNIYLVHLKNIYDKNQKSLQSVGAGAK